MFNITGDSKTNRAEMALTTTLITTHWPKNQTGKDQLQTQCDSSNYEALLV